MANALEFVESEELDGCIEEIAGNLYMALENDKQNILKIIDENEYKEKIEKLKKLWVKEREEGKFETVKGIIDRRGKEY